MTIQDKLKQIEVGDVVAFKWRDRWWISYLMVNYQGKKYVSVQTVVSKFVFEDSLQDIILLEKSKA